MVTRAGAGLRAGAPLVLAVCVQLLPGSAAWAQESRGMGEGLEFSHPLIAESVSPDTKIRLELDRARGPSRSDLALEGEYAFVPAFSLELGVPLERAEGGARSALPGPMEIRAKYIRYLGRTGALGGGATFDVPTESAGAPEGGGRRYGVEPFVDAGLRHGGWEWVGFGRMALANHVTPGDAAATLGYNASALYRFSGRFHALTELAGELPLDGESSGQASLAASPGLEVWPGLGPHVMFGAAVIVPLLSHRDYEYQVALSAFYHF